MKLASERLLFNEITLNDANDIHKLHSYPEVDKYNTLGMPKDINETIELIQPFIEVQNTAKRKSYFWKVVSNETKEFIGIAGMNLSLNKFKLGEIYYKILPDFWGKGYATEISKTLIKSGFEKFHLHKVEAGVATENIASIKVLEKSGMTREGLRRKILPIRGEWKDNYHYAIVEDDPRDY
ncbi:GNAT family N-acetyltransferase [Croceivirga thetidis]|uniref:GNAT family N-acetyltransferase n=1 Tax=Croceivirga thetidis TaxID=2721623 RepID=A0ABX1GLB0_9FLAO|nr:GNAT family N-acetyltransferase [Croceivirga thetidis]NKI30438.1 GNAT family N-acetyltransferase [Croceivirga thetidis]